MARQLLWNWKKDLSIPFYGINEPVEGDPLRDRPVSEANASILACAKYAVPGTRLTMYNLNINGRQMSIDVPGDTPLLWAIRDFFNLTGTKYGCGIGECGACTVHVDGRPLRSCILTVAAAENRQVRTIEALADDPVGARVQKAWLDLQVIQCGYCQSGQIMAAASLLMQTPRPSDDQIDFAMSGNICRCGTYPRIRAAIHHAARS